MLQKGKLEQDNYGAYHSPSPSQLGSKAIDGHLQGIL